MLGREWDPVHLVNQECVGMEGNADRQASLERYLGSDLLLKTRVRADEDELLNVRVNADRLKDIGKTNAGPGGRANRTIAKWIPFPWLGEVRTAISGTFHRRGQVTGG